MKSIAFDEKKRTVSLLSNIAVLRVIPMSSCDIRPGEDEVDFVIRMGGLDLAWSHLITGIGTKP